MRASQSWAGVFIISSIFSDTNAPQRRHCHPHEAEFCSADIQGLQGDLKAQAVVHLYLNFSNEVQLFLFQASCLGVKEQKEKGKEIERERKRRHLYHSATSSNLQQRCMHAKCVILKILQV